MKRIIAVALSLALILSGCSNNASNNQSVEKANENTEKVVESVNTEVDTVSEELAITEAEAQVEEVKNIKDYEPDADDTPFEYEVAFDSLDDENLQRYIEDEIYAELVTQLDSDKYFIENISTVYISQEYIDELTYNSKANIFFGYTLEELEDTFQGTKYVFTLGDEGDTIVVPFEDYDDSYERMIKNVAIGTGVILICVTVSVVTGGVGAPAVSMIFATAAKTATIAAVSSGTIGGIAAGIVTGVETGDMDKAVKAAAVAGSEGYKWGAITGAISGGAGDAVALKGATLNGLTMNQAAMIQKESCYPLEMIKQFHTVEEYKVFKDIGLKNVIVNGKFALVRSDIDLTRLDENGFTNLQRMQYGVSPLDANGKTFELHHIGQKADGSLAILTMEEHDNVVLHGFKAISEIDRKAFRLQRHQFWKTMAQLLESGGI